VSQLLVITYRWARRCVIAVVGSTVVIIGIFMIVLPGPAVIVIPAGLAILAIEFECARRWLHSVRATGSVVIDRCSFWRRRTPVAAARTKM
jgi:tellurite resistance protein TerC